MFTAALVTTLATFTPAASGLAGLLAQTAGAPTSQPKSGGGGIFGGLFGNSFMFPLIILMVVMYVFMISSKRKQDRQKQDALGNLKKGDRVQTIGGIIGNVVQVSPKDDAEQRILLKVDETSNTKIWFSRNAIHRVLGDEKDKEKADAK